jgi:hypothetical protein
MSKKNKDKRENKIKKKDKEKKSKKKSELLEDKSNDIDLQKEAHDDKNTFQNDDNHHVPQFIKDFVEKIHRNANIEFQTINIRVVGEDDLDTLPKELLNQILQKAVLDENFELASKVRDIITNKN